MKLHYFIKNSDTELWSDGTAVVITGDDLDSANTRFINHQGHLVNHSSCTAITINSASHFVATGHWREVDLSEAISRVPANINNDVIHYIQSKTKKAMSVSCLVSGVSFTFFNDGSVKAGCTKFTKEQVDEIVGHINQARA